MNLFLGGGMLINRTNWTSYLTTQVYAIALAVINLCIGIFAKRRKSAACLDRTVSYPCVIWCCGTCRFPQGEE